MRPSPQGVHRGPSPGRHKPSSGRRETAVGLNVVRRLLQLLQAAHVAREQRLRSGSG